jgi:hypothetical protein
MRLITRTLLGLLPVGLIAGFIAAAVSPGSALQSGRVEAINIATGPGVGYASGTFEMQSAALAEEGVEYVREVIDWSQIETSSGIYDWNTWRPLDAIFTAEKASGFEIIAVFDGAPSYLASSDSTVLLVAWANFVQAAVNHFGDRVDVWEIGSRVNSNTGMSSFLLPASPNTSTVPDVDLYAQIVKVAAKIIKAGDPNDEVWMGSLVSATAASCAVNPLTFMLEMNATKAWKSIDSIQYRPERGDAAPEETLSTANSACASSLPANSTTLAGEIQSVTDLARQLGGKIVRLEGVGWSDSELTSLASGRSISADQVLADYLTRSSVVAYSGRNITSVFWRADAQTYPAASAALANLNSALQGAKFVSQEQGLTGSVFEYRFQKGSKWIIIAWHAADGDAPFPVTLSGLTVNRLTAYPVDAADFSSQNGTPISVDDAGNAIVLLNERPVVFIGTTADLGESAKQEINDQLDVWKFEIKAAAHRALNDLKAAAMQALEDMFNRAKEEAIQWGEDKLDELLN